MFTSAEKKRHRNGCLSHLSWTEFLLTSCTCGKGTVKKYHFPAKGQAQHPLQRLTTTSGAQETGKLHGKGEKVKTWSCVIAPSGPSYTISDTIPFPTSSFLKALIRNSTCYSLLDNSVEIQDKSQQVFLHSRRNGPITARQLSQGSSCEMSLSLGSHHCSSYAAQHCHQLCRMAFGAPPGPWILAGDRNSTGPGSGELSCHPQKRRVRTGQGHLPKNIPIISLSSLTMELLSVTSFQGTLIFARTLVSSLLDDKHLQGKA